MMSRLLEVLTMRIALYCRDKGLYFGFDLPKCLGRFELWGWFSRICSALGNSSFKKCPICSEYGASYTPK